MNISGKTVAEIVREDLRSSDAFKKNGIDFCCGGGRVVDEVCERKSLPLEQLQADIEAAISGAESPELDFMEMPLHELVDYIVNTHHSYVRENLPLIRQYAAKAAKVHGDHSPFLIKVDEISEAMSAELQSHMMKEEQMLFPNIVSMEAALAKGESMELPFGRFANPVAMMEHEHDAVGDMCREIRQLTDDLTPPDFACNTWRALYMKLEDFEADLFMHIHLENNILHPRALAMDN